MRYILDLIGIRGDPPPLLRTAMRGFLSSADDLFERAVAGKPVITARQFEEIALAMIVASLAESQIVDDHRIHEVLRELRKGQMSRHPRSAQSNLPNRRLP